MPLQDYDLGPVFDEPALTTRDLGDLDVAEEIFEQYQKAVRLRDNVLDDAEIPANQRAQVLNSVSSILSQLTRLRIQLYDSERMKALEQILLDTLRALPPESRTHFMEVYTRELGPIAS